MLYQYDMYKKKPNALQILFLNVVGKKRTFNFAVTSFWYDGLLSTHCIYIIIPSKF